MEENQNQDNVVTEQQSSEKSELFSEPTSEKLFTQTEVNEIIQKRLNRKNAEFEQLIDYKKTNEIKSTLSKAGISFNDSQLDLIKKMDIDISKSEEIVKIHKDLFGDSKLSNTEKLTYYKSNDKDVKKQISKAWSVLNGGN